MKSLRFDVAVLGSGFGGSLLAAILAGRGKHVALVDPRPHPRFTLGESTTPLGDATLHDLASRYDLPELIPLTSYGGLRGELPHIVCGKKRGFTYLGSVASTPADSTELMMVAASSSEDRSDTHWLRSDVDHHFHEVAVAAGVTSLIPFRYDLTHESDGWRLDGVGDHKGAHVEADFLADATGAAGQVFKTLDVPQCPGILRTRSRAVYAHFRDVASIADVLAQSGVDSSSHPYPCDDAAIHHVLSDGWFWQLPFVDGTVSAGCMIDERQARHARRPAQNGIEQWDAMIAGNAVLAEQFCRASIVRPRDSLVESGPLQRLTTSAASGDWAALPSTAGFIDPLHSTGIAHTLFGVRRLAAILLTVPRSQRPDALQRYSATVIDELRWIDRLVECCYAAKSNFRLWCYASMLYFAAVTSMEAGDPEDRSFLCATDQALREVAGETRARIEQVIASECTDKDLERLREWLLASTEPWNRVGLFRRDEDWMYSSTIAPGR